MVVTVRGGGSAVWGRWNNVNTVVHESVVRVRGDDGRRKWSMEAR